MPINCHRVGQLDSGEHATAPAEGQQGSTPCCIHAKMYSLSYSDPSDLLEWIYTPPIGGAGDPDGNYLPARLL
jgi:hypothetical protein